jgi:peroxiredoxin
MRHRLPILILFAFAASCASAPPSRASALPAAPVVTLAGDSTDVRAALRGKVALVSLWATWCDACTNEVDALNRLSAKTSPRGDAVVLGVAVGEPRETVAAFARQRGLTYALLVDEDFRFADALGERRVPTTLVVDPTGRVVYRGDALDAEGLAAFRKALGE